MGQLPKSDHVIQCLCCMCNCVCGKTATKLKALVIFFCGVRVGVGPNGRDFSSILDVGEGFLFCAVLQRGNFFLGHVARRDFYSKILL